MLKRRQAGRGHPARVTSISWREAIRDAVKATYPQAPFTSPPLGTKFSVEVIFVFGDGQKKAEFSSPEAVYVTVANAVIDASRRRW